MAVDPREIREQIAANGKATPEILRAIEGALAERPDDPNLWVLRGDAIQLSDGDGYELADAERSYREAIRRAPQHAAAHTELGYYYFAVMDDAARALPWFRRAVDLGGGDSAAKGLKAAEAER